MLRFLLVHVFYDWLKGDPRGDYLSQRGPWRVWSAACEREPLLQVLARRWSLTAGHPLCLRGAEGDAVSANSGSANLC